MSKKRIGLFNSCLLVVAVTGVPSTSFAAHFWYEVIVQPYQVSYQVEGISDITAVSDGSLEAFADAVFSQVGVDIELLTPIMFPTMPEGDINDHFFRFQEEAGLGSGGLSVITRTIVPLFIDSLFPPPGQLGLAWVSAAGIIVQSLESILGTFAHELGHNLGLGHLFSGPFSNLMNFGSCGSATLADVTSTINTCDLTSEQIDQVTTELPSLAFAHAVPLSGALGLLTASLFALGVLRRKRIA